MNDLTGTLMKSAAYFAWKLAVELRRNEWGFYDEGVGWDHL